MNRENYPAKLVITATLLLVLSFTTYGSGRGLDRYEPGGSDKSAIREAIKSEVGSEIRDKEIYETSDKSISEPRGETTEETPLYGNAADETVYEVYKEDILYSVKGPDSLYLTRYFYNPKLDNPNITDKKQPVIMFLFGGNFIEGNRNYKPYISYFIYYVKKGYQVVTIDYRKGLRKWYSNYIKEVESGKQPNVKEQEISTLLMGAVDLAVADCITATNFIISKSDKWHTDNDKIILSGSSAGAITALQTEYYHSNRYFNSDVKVRERLPKNFSYAGIISFAGAVFTQKGEPAFGNNVTPVLFFHGDADPSVPYNYVNMYKGGIYGSAYLAENFLDSSHPFSFCKTINADHGIAFSAMNNMVVIDEFLKDYIIKQKRSYNIREESVKADNPLKKNFTLYEYLFVN